MKTGLNIASTFLKKIARNSHQQYRFMHKVQFLAKYPLFDSQSDSEFSFSYAILLGIIALLFDYIWTYSTPQFSDCSDW